VQSVLPVLATAVFVAWIAGHSGWSAEKTAVAVLVSALVIAVIAWRAARPQPTLLNWDGQCWTVDDAATQPQVMVDLNRWMLLRLTLAPRARWFAVSASAAGPAWHGLRAALYAMQSSQDAAPAHAGPHV
jgi:hypothetical protein